MNDLHVGDLIKLNKIPTGNAKYKYMGLTGKIIKIDSEGDVYLYVNTKKTVEYFRSYWVSRIYNTEFASITQKDVLIKCTSVENFNQTLARAEEAGYYLNSDFPVDCTNFTAIVSKHKPKTL